MSNDALRLPQRTIARKRASSLYLRVVVVNATLLLGGLAALLWTPVTVSAPVSMGQMAVLVGAIMILVVVDAAIVKVTFNGLDALVHQMQTLDLLRPRERLPEMGGKETRALIAGFNTMLDRLEAERRESTLRMVATLEDERRRISRDLHDEIGQRMTAILLQLALLHDDVPNTVRASIAALQNRARALLEEIGALAWRIRPAILDDVGLTAALTALTDSMGAHGSARIETALPQQLAPMSREAESAIYRIAQEALTNALRHACAATITLHLQVDDTTLLLGVIDDGCTPPDAIVDGPGLRGMRERALMIGGQLTLEANQPQGLRVRLALPLGHLGG